MSSHPGEQGMHAHKTSIVIVPSVLKCATLAFPLA